MSDWNRDELLEILDNPTNPKKPWMTAGRIADRLTHDRSQGPAIEKFLLKEYARQVDEARDPEADPPDIRYSSLPSRRSLEVLWGATALVGERNLSNLTKDDDAVEFLETSEALGRPGFFFSHSHKDYEDVMTIARWLVGKGVHTWLAETHIEKDQTIHYEIIDALREANRILLFLSENALRSRWTEKELMNSVIYGKSIYIITDVESELIRNAAASALCGNWSAFAEAPSGRWDTSTLVREFASTHQDSIQWFAYPQTHAELPEVSHYHTIPARLEAAADPNSAN